MLSSGGVVMVVALRASGRNFSDRLVDFLNMVECRAAEDEADREAIFRLRYKAYRREGAIDTDRSRKFSDDYDDTENAWTFGLHIDDRLVSSIRIHVASPDNPESPAVSVFPDLLAPELDAGRRIIDPTRFVTDHAATSEYPELPYATIRLAFAAMQFFSADVALATVRSEHQAFYKRLFGFRPLCMPRIYPTLTKPIMLMEKRVPELVELLTQFPFMGSTFTERRALFEREVTPVAPPTWFRPAPDAVRTVPGLE